MIKADIAILGAGLTGLTLHYLLRETDLRVVLLEARDRVGGRIFTTEEADAPPIEMGATWLGKKHQHLVALLKELQIDLFPQRLGAKAIYEPISTSPHQLVTLPPNEEPSYRIQGGTSTLINRLAEFVQSDQLFLGQAAEKISETKDGLQVECWQATFQAAKVISTLPPYLLKKTIEIEPELPPKISGLLSKTHTWMGESIKFGLTYKKPFWRESDTSGTVFSNPGPITELYDHASVEDNRFALKGFLQSTYYSLKKEERLDLILTQLRKYYGKACEDFVRYQELVWPYERYTYAPYEDHILPHQNNGHPDYHKPYLNGKFIIAGSETAPAFPGYMDGAVGSALLVYEQLKEILPT